LSRSALTEQRLKTEILVKRFCHLSLVFPKFLVQLFQSESLLGHASRGDQQHPASLHANRKGESMVKLNGTKIHPVMRVLLANFLLDSRAFSSRKQLSAGR
jgi:hypothetical protein